MHIFPTILSAAQPAAAGAGWHAQSMRTKIADFDKKFAACNAHYKELQEKPDALTQLHERLWKISNNTKTEYEQRKSIIKAAIEQDGIHPNDISAAKPFSCLVCEAADSQDLDFVQFLLKNNANPNRKSNGIGFRQCPTLVYARYSIPITQALFDAGASLKEHGVRALNAAITHHNQGTDDTVSWLLDHGVPANDYFEDYTPLLRCIYKVTIYYEVNFEQVQLLLQEGALLSLRVKGKQERKYYGYNVLDMIASKKTRIHSREK